MGLGAAVTLSTMGLIGKNSAAKRESEIIILARIVVLPKMNTAESCLFIILFLLDNLKIIKRQIVWIIS